MRLLSSRSKVSRLYATICVGAGCLLGCGATAPKASSSADFDRPVPAGEPRATLALLLDLHAANDCEERFDLAIYADRGIELVNWDDDHGGCVQRQVTIRYLTAKLDEAALLALVREHAKRVEKSKR